MKNTILFLLLVFMVNISLNGQEVLDISANGMKSDVNRKLKSKVINELEILLNQYNKRANLFDKKEKVVNTESMRSFVSLFGPTATVYDDISEDEEEISAIDYANFTFQYLKYEGMSYKLDNISILEMNHREGQKYTCKVYLDKINYTGIDDYKEPKKYYSGKTVKLIIEAFIDLDIEGTNVINRIKQSAVEIKKNKNSYFNFSAVYNRGSFDLENNEETGLIFTDVQPITSSVGLNVSYNYALTSKLFLAFEAGVNLMSIDTDFANEFDSIEEFIPSTKEGYENGDPPAKGNFESNFIVKKYKSGEESFVGGKHFLGSIGINYMILDREKFNLLFGVNGSANYLNGFNKGTLNIELEGYNIPEGNFPSINELESEGLLELYAENKAIIQKNVFFDDKLSYSAGFGVIGQYIISDKLSIDICAKANKSLTSVINNVGVTMDHLISREDQSISVLQDYQESVGWTQLNVSIGLSLYL